MDELHTVRHSPGTTPERTDDTADVLTVDALGEQRLRPLLERLGLSVARVGDSDTIPGSFWGDEEAGLIGDTLYVRGDTPVHSALHETGHYVCMDSRRRAALHTNAGGTYDEENAVCYWQILASDLIDGVGRARMCADMDRWGYTFRLGSAAAWFAEDAEDARAWLENAALVDSRTGTLSLTLRT